MPSSLGRVPKRLFPVFIDRSELASSADLGDSLREALRQSRSLIVICSPHSARSQWVEEETSTFKRLGRSERILALIVDGEPNAEDKPGVSVERECFCDALRYKWVDGKLSTRLAEPVAADARRVGDGRRDAFLKLVAGVLGVPFDTLKQRDLQRRHRRLIRISIAGLALMLIITSLALFGWFGWNRADDLAVKYEALATEEKGLRLEAERKMALAAMDRGLSLCEQGDIRRGMLWLARGLELAPDDTSDLDWVVRSNLAAWHRWLVQPSPPLKQDDTISHVAFSPDGRIAASRSDYTWIDTTGKRYYRDRVVRLWDTVRRVPIGGFLQHDASVEAMAFAPDSKFLAVGCGKEVRLWNTTTGKPAGIPLAHGGPVESVSFSPDGKALVTRTGRSWEATTVHLWNVATRQEILSAPGYAVAFSSDGKYLAAGTEHDYVDGSVMRKVVPREVRVWEAATGKSVGQPMRHDGEIHCVAFSPDGSLILTGSGAGDEKNGEARLWSTDTGAPISEPLTHGFPVTSMAFSPDGRWFVTGAMTNPGGEVRLWKTSTAKPMADPVPFLSGFSGYARFAFSPGGATVLVAAGRVKGAGGSPVGRGSGGSPSPWGDGHAWLWKPRGNIASTIPLEHKRGIHALAFSADGELAVTISQDGIRLWDADNGESIGQPASEPNRIQAAVVRRNRILLAVGDALRIWKTPTAWRNSKRFVHDEYLCPIAASKPGDIALASRVPLGIARDTMVSLWDTKERIGKRLQHEGFILCSGLSPDGRIAATGGENEVRLWDVTTATPLGDPLTHQGDIDELVFSPDSKSLLVRSSEEVRLWSLHSKEPACVPLGPRSPCPQRDYFGIATFSPDGRKIVTLSGKGTRIEIWDAISGKPIGAPIRQDADRIVFGADGKTLLTMTRQDTVRLWDATAGRAIGPPVEHVIAASPDSKTFLKTLPTDPEMDASDDGGRVAQLVDGASGKHLGRPLRHEAFIYVAVFSSDGTMVLTGSGAPVIRLEYTNEWTSYGQTRLWNARTGEPIGQAIRHMSPVKAVAFSDDGRAFATRTYDNQVRLWSTALIRPIGMPFCDRAVSDIQFGSEHLIAFEMGRHGSVFRDLRYGQSWTTSQRWEVPAPVAGEVDDIVLWIHAITGLELDQNGGVRPLDEQIWKDRVQQMENAGGTLLP